MSPTHKTRASKFLSLVLRHDPQAAGVQLEAEGWIDVALLLNGLAAHGCPLTRDELNDIVATSDKKRFAFNPDGSKIRASQGHSVDVEINFDARTPPEFLFHGTATRFLDSIRAEGLRSMDRHHVHLSADEPTARAVGARHGKPVILKIRAGALHGTGHPFFQSANGVWLTASITPDYIEFPPA